MTMAYWISSIPGLAFTIRELEIIELNFKILIDIFICPLPPQIQDLHFAWYVNWTKAEKVTQ